MMILKDVITALDAIAPFETAEEWDNVGLMVGDPESMIRSVMVSLDPSFEVISAAEEAEIDLILTHHPLIFNPLKRIDLQDMVPRKIAMLIRSGINLVSMHTNLDKAQGGVADELARRLSLSDFQAYGVMRTGYLKAPVALRAWLEGLGVASPRFIDAGREVFHVALCPGSGMDYWRKAHDLGCDTFVTGDVRYHAGLEALEAGVNVVDLGHFATEDIIVEPLAERLRQDLKGILVHTRRGRDIFSINNN